MSTPGDEPYEYNPEDYDDTAAEHSVPTDEWDDYVPGVSEAPPRWQPRNYAAMETATEHRAKVLHDKPSKVPNSGLFWSGPKQLTAKKTQGYLFCPKLNLPEIF